MKRARQLLVRCSAGKTLRSASRPPSDNVLGGCVGIRTAGPAYMPVSKDQSTMEGVLFIRVAEYQRKLEDITLVFIK